MSTPAPGVSAQIQCPLLGESAQAPGPGAAEAATADNGSAAPAACPVIQQRSGQLTCPVCGSLRTHRSRRRGLLDRMIVYIGGKIRRCDVCWVGDGIRTRDIRNHNPTLYQLSYTHRGLGENQFNIPSILSFRLPSRPVFASAPSVCNSAVIVSSRRRSLNRTSAR